MTSCILLEISGTRTRPFPSPSRRVGVLSVGIGEALSTSVDSGNHSTQKAIGGLSLRRLGNGLSIGPKAGGRHFRRPAGGRFLRPPERVDSRSVGPRWPRGDGRLEKLGLCVSKAIVRLCDSAQATRACSGMGTAVPSCPSLPALPASPRPQSPSGDSARNFAAEVSARPRVLAPQPTEPCSLGAGTLRVLQPG